MLSFSKYLAAKRFEGAHYREQEVQNKHFDAQEYPEVHYAPLNESTDEEPTLVESIEPHPTNPKRLVFKGSEAKQTGVRGLVVPRHMWEGTNTTGTNKDPIGMERRNQMRAEVYGADHRAPLNIGQMGKVHKKVLDEHFAKPLKDQLAAEKAAIKRLHAAGHGTKNGHTTDESEKTDTILNEVGKDGRGFLAIASKGVAGHAVYTSGVGADQRHHIINTCPGQTEGCGGGKDANGIADTTKGTCFAPNAEHRYPAAAVRRAYLDQARHDPAMTGDYILAHTNSIRMNAKKADKQNRTLVVRPNTLNENDVSSRHVIKGLNAQRQAEGKANIISYQYSKTGELHDPENGFHVTHSNIGPKVKAGATISENVSRDRTRIRNTITAQSASGEHFKNDQGNQTPPMNSYMVHNIRRGSDMDKRFQEATTHVKYWSAGREQHELSADERAQGNEGHFDGEGKPTTPDQAHYGFTTLNSRRYDYQKQHVLHPRMTPVKDPKSGETHLIPSDSRFMDDDHMPPPERRFKSKNGKLAGGIMATSTTTSTSIDNMTNSSFTHHVSEDMIKEIHNKGGEWEIDKPEHQEAALGTEWSPAQKVDISGLKKKK